MSEHCFYQQYPYKRQFNCEGKGIFSQNNNDNYNYNGRDKYHYDNLMNDTPTPGQCEDTTIFDSDHTNIYSIMNDQSSLNYFNQNQGQTLPYPYMCERQSQDYLSQDYPIHCYDFPYLQELEQENVQQQQQQQSQQQQQQVREPVEEQPNQPNQSTDAQIQSQQDNQCVVQQKEKVKVQQDKLFQEKYMNKLYKGQDITEEEIQQLNDEERAIYYSCKNQLILDNSTPQPPEEELKEDNTYNISQSDLLQLDQNIDVLGCQSQLFASQGSNELSDQSQYSFAQIDQSSSQNQQMPLPQKRQKKNNSNSNPNQKSFSFSPSLSGSSLLNKKKAKRVEEMQKMVFKKSFTFIQNKYFRERVKKSRISSKDKDNYQFYEHFFSEASLTHKIPLKNFFHPQKQIKKGEKTKEDTPGQKSFNQAYISLILKSKPFRSQVEDYISNQIQPQIEEERQQKIVKVIANLKKKYAQFEKEIDMKSLSGNTPQKSRKGSADEKLISQTWESGQDSTATTNTPYQSDEIVAKLQSERFSLIVEKLEDYIHANSKLKLPWSDSQINQAILLAKQSLANHID